MIKSKFGIIKCEKKMLLMCYYKLVLLIFIYCATPICILKHIDYILKHNPKFIVKACINTQYSYGSIQLKYFILFSLSQEQVSHDM